MDVRRRDFLFQAALVAASSRFLGCAGQEASPKVAVRPTAGDGPAAPKAGPKKVLILGGTKFLGPQLVEASRARGHTLTLFNRGKTNPQLFPDVEKLHGDRDTGDLAALRGRTWDVVIDTSGFVPRKVKASAELLASAGQYVFVSTISVYDKPPVTGVDEESAVGQLSDPSVEKVDEATYGPLKAACERAAEAAMPGRVTSVRPGLIVGPGDGTDRFTYWPARIQAGGEVMAPGIPADPVQFIDVRDLAEWMVTVFEKGHMGVYNAVGPAQPLTVGELLKRTNDALGGGARFEWVDAKFLAEHKVEPWSDMPVWVPGDGADAGVARTSIKKALAKGLAFRPLETTAKDTATYWNGLPEDRRQKPRAGISRAREAEVLAAWHERAKAR